MENQVFSLLEQLSPKAREKEALRAELDELIDRLERQQQTLEHRLLTETRGLERQHLKITLEVGCLQLKKAQTLRTNLTSTQGNLKKNYTPARANI